MIVELFFPIRLLISDSKARAQLNKTRAQLTKARAHRIEAQALIDEP